jgi:hypothetical protein
MTPTTAELTRAAHDAHVASIPDADLRGLCRSIRLDAITVVHKVKEVAA